MKHLDLINKIVYNPKFYSLYFHLGSFALSILKLFVRPDDNLVLFVSFGGRRFDDSPKAIYDSMILDDRFKEYRLIWAFLSPEDYSLNRGKKVKIDTLRFFITALRARLWITNSSITRGLSFKGKRTLYYNSWHGTAIKKMGTDISGNDGLPVRKGKLYDIDIMSAQGHYDVEVFSRVFNIPLRNFHITGLPRNDELAGSDVISRKRIRGYYSIPEDKRIILYAPTYREYSRDENDNCFMAPPISLKKWEEALGNEYVLLFRAHYEVTRVLNVDNTLFAKDASNYPVLNDLMLASDMLITDYSSICFDYAIQSKPIFCFAYDYELYNTKRGLYFDLREELGDQGIKTEDDLLFAIKRINYDCKVSVTKRFREKYVTAYGKATQEVLNLLYDAIQSE